MLGIHKPGMPPKFEVQLVSTPTQPYSPHYQTDKWCIHVSNITWKKGGVPFLGNNSNVTT